MKNSSSTEGMKVFPSSSMFTKRMAASHRFPFWQVPACWPKATILAEGDANVLLLTVIGHMLIGDPHFTEMYSLDFGKDAAMLSHMGEGNWKVAAKTAA